jgi:hypothetical protein
MHTEWTDLLSSYLDGELDAITRRRLEAHLAGCPECAAVRDDLARIVAVAPGYQGTPPRADLWPAIATAIDRDRVVSLPARRTPVGVTLRYLIAAGVTIAAVGSGVYWYRASNLGAPAVVATVPSRSAEAVPAALESAKYDAAVAELEQILATRRGALDSTTVRVLEESLALIDRAIAEARAAIQRDPANAYLNEQIAGNLRKKLNVLRLATRAIASET